MDVRLMEICDDDDGWNDGDVDVRMGDSLCSGNIRSGKCGRNMQLKPQQKRCLW